MAKGKKEEKPKDQLDATAEQEEGIILDDDVSDEEEVKKDKEESKEEVKEEVKDEEKKEEIKDEKKPEPIVKEEAPIPIEKDTTAAVDATSDVKAPVQEDEGSVPPPKPKRPLSAREEAKKNLKDAFPTVEDSTIEAILIASSFKLEPAFNALLYLSDPSAIKFDEVPTFEEQAPPTPRRQLSQLEQDELLAKRLDEEYNKNQRRRHRHRQQQGQQQYPGGQQQQRGSRRRGADGAPLDSDTDDDVLTNFVEKDLPQIKEQFSKNLEETKSKFNNWVSGWKKQYQETTEEWNARNRGGSSSNRGGNRGSQRRYEFEDDPEEVDVREFHGISLGNNDDEDGDKPKLPNRNRSQSTDLYGTPKHGQSTTSATTTNTGGKKWEPLQTKAPEPIKSTKNDDDDDDFLLSDDDEDLVKK